MRKVIQNFDHFSLTVHDGSLYGENQYLHQHVTTQRCRYSHFQCVPKEKPLSILIWEKSPHVFRSFRPIGQLPVHLINKHFVLIPTLGVGGSVIEKYKNHFLLDTGYIIRDPSHNMSEIFLKDAKDYAANVKFSAQDDVSEANFIVDMDRIIREIL